MNAKLEIHRVFQIQNEKERKGEPLYKPQLTHFCYKVIEKALDSIIHSKYSKFNPHTTANCCHGASLLVQESISEAQKEEPDHFVKLVRKKIEDSSEDPFWLIPKAFVTLGQFLILHHILEITPKGVRTCPKKLNDFSSIGKKTSMELVKYLQGYYANLIARRYQYYLDQIPEHMESCIIPMKIWGKYISPPYWRKDRKGISYVSNLYSMQVFLSYLICSKSMIAILNDIVNSQREVRRYLKVFQGDGIGGFSPMSFETCNDPKLKELPVIVFTGCSLTIKVDEGWAEMDLWMNKIPNLILAQDVHYPEFPQVESGFNSSRTVPDEEVLKRLIDDHQKIEGMSVKNPKIYCLNHIHTLSMNEVLLSREGEEAPLSLKILALHRSLF